MNTSLGLKRKTVKLVEHNPEWISLFEKEKFNIQVLLGERVLDIQHIGSTAVPNLKAKPALDLMIAIKNVDDWEWLQVPLSTLKYMFRRDSRKDQQHILFVKGPDEKRTHYLKITELDSDFWTSQIRFRDLLLSNESVRRKYEELKENMFEKYDRDREQYTNGKSNFIEKVLREDGYTGRIV